MVVTARSYGSFRGSDRGRTIAPLGEYLKVLRVLPEGQLNGFVDELRDRPLRHRRLEPQGSVNLWVEVDGSAL